MWTQPRPGLLQELNEWAKKQGIFQTIVSSPEVGKTTITYSKPPTVINVTNQLSKATQERMRNTKSKGTITYTPVNTFIKNIPPKEEEYESGILEELFQMPE